MTNKPLNLSSDLLAIANPKLAEKINKQNKLKQSTETPEPEKLESSAHHKRFKDEIWRAVSTLNIFRYLTALILLGMSLAPYLNPEWHAFDSSVEKTVVTISSIVLLVSAVGFTVLARTQAIDFHLLLQIQFALDLLLTTALVHANGGIMSNYVFFYFAVVTTGSVVLRRKHAIALASGAVILLFCEHFYSSFLHSHETYYSSLASISVSLMLAGWLVSYLAQRLRLAELQTFIPGQETIEEFLVREEIRALQNALKQTNGNKTAAAELLGMTFRSFRYKLTKYDIG